MGGVYAVLHLHGHPFTLFNAFLMGGIYAIFAGLSGSFYTILSFSKIISSLGGLGVVLKRTNVLCLVVTVLFLSVVNFFLCRLGGLWCGCGCGGHGTYGDPSGFTLSHLKILDN